MSVSHIAGCVHARRAVYSVFHNADCPSGLWPVLSTYSEHFNIGIRVVSVVGGAGALLKAASVCLSKSENSFCELMF